MEVKISDTGVRFIEQDGTRLRDSYAAHRLVEDGETFEEYRYRRSVVNKRGKDSLKGTYLWLSKTDRYNQELQDILVKNEGNVRLLEKTDTYKRFANSNLGTYNKKQVQEYLDKYEENNRERV